MDIEPEGIIRLDKADLKRVSQMFTRAFYNDPFSLYAFPDIKERDSKLIYMIEMSLRYGLRYGMVYAPSARIEGGAIWMPPGKWAMTISGILLSGALSSIIRMGLKAELKMMPIDKFMEEKHKKLAPFPHWYLALLGGDPQYQKQGYASKLLRGMLDEIDKQGLPAYLETDSEKNYLMYQHFGFKIIDELILPKAGIRLWSMLREKASD